MMDGRLYPQKLTPSQNQRATLHSHAASASDDVCGVNVHDGENVRDRYGGQRLPPPLRAEIHNEGVYSIEEIGWRDRRPVRLPSRLKLGDFDADDFTRGQSLRNTP